MKKYVQSTSPVNTGAPFPSLPYRVRKPGKRIATDVIFFFHFKCRGFRGSLVMGFYAFHIYVTEETLQSCNARAVWHTAASATVLTTDHDKQRRNRLFGGWTLKKVSALKLISTLYLVENSFRICHSSQEWQHNYSQQKVVYHARLLKLENCS